MHIDTVILRHLEMELKSPFTTSFGTMKTRPVLLVEAIDENGERGWGEGVAFSAPWYTEETLETTWHMLEHFLIPLLFQEPVYHPDELHARFSMIRRNYMAKAALEGAVWDLFAKRRRMSLSAALGGEKQEVEVGISIGIQPITNLLKRMEQALAEGYRRVKIKIKQDGMWMSFVSFVNISLMFRLWSMQTPLTRYTTSIAYKRSMTMSCL
ncbi:o-succinylbenzoate synthase [Anoxybacillus sp. BCO1]|nr:o-succinylbenzoate synthase [Anoxybacillus sp. BCO1]